MTEPELKTLGRYTIERVLGKGGMGVVYEGVDPRLNRRVAIKTILKSNLDQDMAQEYSARFVREAQIAARLSHPNIVQIHDFGEEGDIAYLVMEFIKGRELRVFFDAKERFEVKETVRIMGELCEALDFAHQAGIIHRDVKPANVMLDSRARVKLADFGVARVQDASLSHVTVSMVGTPAYMSPEQISGGSVDKRTDVFSAGIILYQFLTGEMPFAGGGAWTIAKRIMQDQPSVPSSLNTSIPPLLDAVVYKALAKNANERYQSAHELAVDLRRAFAGEAADEDPARTIIAPLKPAANASRAPVSPEPPTVISAPRHDLGARREAELKPQASAGGKKTSAVVAIIAGVVLAAGGAAYLLRPGSDEKMRQMQQQLEQAKKQAQELEQAKRKEDEARIALEKARAAEAQAKRSGDIAKQKELLIVRQKAEAEAKKDAEAARIAVQQKLAAERAAAERATQEKAATAKLTEEKERQQWDAVKASTNPRDFDRYLSAYPNGHYVELARTLQAKLTQDLKVRQMLEEQQRVQTEAREREEQAAKEKRQAEKRKPVFVAPTF